MMENKSARLASKLLWKLGKVTVWPVFLVLLILPAYSYDLGKPGCGGEYGGISIYFSGEMGDFSDVEAKLSMLPWAKKTYSLINAGEKHDASLQSEIKKAWENTQSRRYTTENGNIDVPIGSERFIAQSLTDIGVISAATHPVGVCGGTEVSYVFIAKSAVTGDLCDATNFANFLRDKMGKYITKGQVSGTLEEGSLAISPIEPHYAIKKFTVSVPSEISRGSPAQGTWDKFDIFFAMLASRSNDFVVVIHSEGLKVAPRTALRASPPSSEHFRAISSGDSHADYQAEYITAASVASFMGEAASKCKIETDGFSAETDGPFKCGSKSELRLTIQ